MEIRDKNSNNNQSKKYKKEENNHGKQFNSNVTDSKTIPNSKKDKSLSQPQKRFPGQASFRDTKDKQSSLFNKSYRDTSLDRGMSKDDDDLDLSCRSKPRDWRKQKQKQKQDALELQDYVLMENMDKIQRQQEWEEKRKKNHIKKSEKKKSKKFHDDYDEYSEWENDGWN